MADKFDLVFNAVCPRNRNPWFFPLGQVLRGEAQVSELSGKNIPSAILQVGGKIPGHQLRVDTKNRTVDLVDRMTLPENREIDAKLRELTKTDEYRFAAYGKYDETKNWELSEKEWRTFLYHSRRAVDHGRLVIVQGQKLLPSLDEILEMGEVELGENCNVPAKNPDKPFYMANHEHIAGVDRPKATGVTA